MSPNTDEVRVWLVERGYNNRDLIILKYATPDGKRLLRRELAAQVVDADTATAARAVAPENLEAVEEDDLQERYAEEVKRMREKHDPEDTV